MAVWGIAPRIEQGRPIVTALELSGSVEAPEVVRALTHRCEPGDPARALFLLSTYLETELRKAPPRVVVVRAMDWTPNRRETTVRPRLHVEGVILAAVRREVETVQALSGKVIGDLLQLGKAGAEARAKVLLPGQDLNAALAGLAALALDQGG